MPTGMATMEIAEKPKVTRTRRLVDRCIHKAKSKHEGNEGPTSRLMAIETLRMITSTMAMLEVLMMAVNSMTTTSDGGDEHDNDRDDPNDDQYHPKQLKRIVKRR